MPDAGTSSELTRAGVAVVARDTGRVLMIQRASDAPGGGDLWEFPGGRPKKRDDDPWDTASREWEEEVGQPVPDGDNLGGWISPNGYHGYVIAVPAEFDLAPQSKQEGDVPRSVRWVTVDEARRLDLRPETTDAVPWGLLASVAKVTKVGAHYRRGTVERNCRVCTYMNDDGSCDRVQGMVRPEMVCDLFAPMTESVSEKKDALYTASDLGLKQADFRFIQIDPQLPNIDRLHYQRRLDEGEVHRLVHKEGPKKVAKHECMAAEREDGSYWVIDGQHHTLAGIVLDLPLMSYWTFKSTGWEQEKEVFERLQDWRKDVGLKKSIAPYVRASFCNGWAEAGDDALPVPAWAGEKMREALDWASENAHRDGVLEAVRQDGRLHGLYAALNYRRDALESKWGQRLAPVLTRYAGLSSVTSVLRRLPRKVSEAEGDSQTPPIDRQALIEAIETALADIANTDMGDELDAILAEAAQDAVAEGQVTAQTYLSHSSGDLVPSMDHAHATALSNLRDRVDTSGWLTQINHGYSYSLGNAVATAAEQGADYNQLLDVARGIVGDDNAAFLDLNHLIAGAVSDEASSTYEQNGVEMVDLLTAPDAEEDCVDIADQNPWALSDAPDVPVHYRCRCSWAPH